MRAWLVVGVTMISISTPAITNVTTGHITLYHYDYQLSVQSELSVGRYLAGDYGATTSMVRVFDSGASFGVFATKTDVTSEEFGGGSFGKGFFIRIPFDLFSPISSKSIMSFSFRPLTRDGGQTVRDGIALWDAQMIVIFYAWCVTEWA